LAAYQTLPTLKKAKSTPQKSRIASRTKNRKVKQEYA